MGNKPISTLSLSLIGILSFCITVYLEVQGILGILSAIVAIICYIKVFLRLA